MNQLLGQKIVFYTYETPHKLKVEISSHREHCISETVIPSISLQIWSNFDQSFIVRLKRIFFSRVN